MQSNTSVSGPTVSGVALMMSDTAVCDEERPCRITLRTEAHTSELQSQMPTSYSVSCLKKTSQYSEYNNKKSSTNNYKPTSYTYTRIRQKLAYHQLISLN